jgi:hypothetical protein
VTKAYIDFWQSTGHTTREHILRFIRWAIKAKLVASDLEVTPNRRGNAPRPITQHNAVIEQVAHQQTLHPRDRLAAILIIVFAQRAEDVAALTWDKIAITVDTVTIDLAGLPIHLPLPLDEPVRALAASNYNSQTAAHRNSPWVFRDYTPGRHVAPTHLRSYLRPVLAALEARLGTLNELTQTTPIAILAEAIGYSPSFSGRMAIVALGALGIDLIEHATNGGESFRPARAGLDHLSFPAGSLAELQSWASWLDACGVSHSGVRDVADIGGMLNFVDPDGIQLEFIFVDLEKLQQGQYTPD